MRYINFLDHKVIKTAAATVISIGIANYLDLKYALTAGVIAIISIQGTRRDTYKIALERIAATTIGLLISSLLFEVFGANYIVLGAFVLIFMPICVRLNLLQGFLVNVVLATHLISEQGTSLALFFNEFGILLIGLGTALAFNIYMPDTNRELRKLSKEMGRTIQNILQEMGNSLRCNCVSINEKNLINILKEQGNRARDLAIIDFNNAIFSNSSESLDYFKMRYVQYKILKRMRLHFSRLYQVSEQSLRIADLIDQICYTTFDNNEITKVLEAIYECKEYFRNSELPKDRDEFENRAILYGFLNDLEEFASVVRDFLELYPNRRKNSNGSKK